MGAFWLLHAIKMGHIYRPAEGWLWADPDPLGCTDLHRSIDCYFEITSPCGSNHTSTEGSSLTALSPTVFHRLDTMDTCSLAKAAKRPVEWVFYQVSVIVA
jgi:hypothetical protein